VNIKAIGCGVAVVVDIDDLDIEQRPVEPTAVKLT
jgi:hypothetical protein